MEDRTHKASPEEAPQAKCKSKGKAKGKGRGKAKGKGKGKKTQKLMDHYSLGIGESYGPPAQYMQDCPIFFRQLNYVHNNKEKGDKVLQPYDKLPYHKVALGIPLPLSQFSHFA